MSFAILSEQVGQRILKLPYSIKLSDVLTFIIPMNSIKALTLGNCAFNYNTFHLEPTSPSHLSTIKSSVKYDVNAQAPIFKNALHQWFDDNDDIAFVQEWFGYVLSNSFKANAFLIVYSKGGEGKSTLFGLLEQLVGVANTTAIPLSNFNKDFGLEPLLNKNLISQLNHRRANSAPTN